MTKVATKYEFHIVEEEITVEGITATTYGIESCDIRIADVSLDKDKVLKFCQILNESNGEKDINILKDLIEYYFA